MYRRNRNIVGHSYADIQYTLSPGQSPYSCQKWFDYQQSYIHPKSRHPAPSLSLSLSLSRLIVIPAMQCHPRSTPSPGLHTETLPAMRSYHSGPLVTGHDTTVPYPFWYRILVGTVIPRVSVREQPHWARRRRHSTVAGGGTGLISHLSSLIRISTRERCLFVCLSYTSLSTLLPKDDTPDR